MRGIAIVLLAFLGSMIAVGQENTIKGKTVVFVYGGWEGHEPKQCRDVFVPWMESEGAKVIASETLDIYTNEEVMNEADVIVQCWTMGNITAEQERGLLNAVRSGKGIAGWHGGLGDSFRNNTEYQFMIGGQWVAHPDNAVDYVVNITDHNDPIMEGIADFNIHSEQYYMHVDPNVQVLATTVFKDSKSAPWINNRVMPVVWKIQYGKGKVFYASFGHVANEFSTIPEMMEIMKRGIRWAAEK